MGKLATLTRTEVIDNKTAFYLWISVIWKKTTC